MFFRQEVTGNFLKSLQYQSEEQKNETGKPPRSFLKWSTQELKSWQWKKNKGDELNFNVESMAFEDYLDVKTKKKGGVEEIMLRFLILAIRWLWAQLTMGKTLRDGERKFIKYILDILILKFCWKTAENVFHNTCLSSEERSRFEIKMWCHLFTGRY